MKLHFIIIDLQHLKQLINEISDVRLIKPAPVLVTLHELHMFINDQLCSHFVLRNNLTVIEKQMFHDDKSD